MKKIRFLMPVIVLSLLVWSCTNLDENPLSQVTPDNFFQTEAELVSAVIPVYAALESAVWSDYFQTQEHTSDEMFVPQRGGDWGDGGTWRALQEHTWTASFPGFVNGAWNDAFRGIARANATIDNLERSTSDSPLIPTFIAEVRFLRAFFYSWLMDEFGPVPIVTTPTTDPDNPPTQNTRQEVFDFIVSEVNAALPSLEDSHGSGGYGRVTKAAANTLLATVYLNAEVYTGTARWNECVSACDAVINSGLFDLIPNYNDVFSLENEGSNPEYIFVVGRNPEDGVAFFRQQSFMHYNQSPVTPWNGFSILEDFFNTFDQDDARFQQVLVGAQFVLVGPNAGDPAFDRNGNPLIFTPDSPLIGADEGQGARLLKWPIDPNANAQNQGNDYAIYRYSHVLLAKAEALFNLGTTGEALALVNQVRARSFEPDKPLAALTSDLILDERGFEFLWEGFRRTDQIRHGKFLDAWSNKAASDGPHRNLFPIPQVQRDANPNLAQNPGY